jgi:cytoskeletal protein RodZ
VDQEIKTTMTRLFKRNNKTTIAELEEYYANQDRKKTRTSMAWLMAILSLVITLAVIALIFFGGRWLYRTLTDDNNATTADTTSTGQVELPTFDSDVIGNGVDQDESDDDSLAGQSSTGTVSDSAASTSIPNTDRVTQTGPSNEALPNTGAGELIAIAPLTVGVVGYLVSRKRFLKNS